MPNLNKNILCEILWLLQYGSFTTKELAEKIGSTQSSILYACRTLVQYELIYGVHAVEKNTRGPVPLMWHLKVEKKHES